ncbi:MAG: hypothetical protein A2516_00175 [Alphaproteobacteria bacterium RIFOXYD12_FULL_60_8]|nr:MAG: hypothetical protein A2516_00175 [Alphaproteobacteria bacterium RIFOXYD12_FULL_60_8]
MRRMKFLHTIKVTGLFTLFAVGLGWGLLALKTNPTLIGDLTLLSEKARQEGLRITARWGLSVQRIVVEGRTRTDVEHLLTALKAREGDPILGLDVEQTRERIEALPWVEKAAVERRLPGSVRIVIQERQPAALWQRKAGLALVDVNGVVIPDHIDGYESLPRLSGEGAPERILEALRLLASQPELSSRVAAAHLVAERRWDVLVMIGEAKSGLMATVRLPEELPEAAWKRLADLHRDQDLLNRDLDMIDLRYEGRVILHVRGTMDPGNEDLKTKAMFTGSPA